MKYVLDTKEFGLNIKPTLDNLTNWNMKMFSDSDYVGDKEARKSVTGYVLFLYGVLITWKSKAQRSVSLSSLEAEYIALFEAVKEIHFVYYMLMLLRIKVEVPITV